MVSSIPRWKFHGSLTHTSLHTSQVAPDFCRAKGKSKEQLHVRLSRGAQDVPRPIPCSIELSSNATTVAQL